MFFVLYDRYFKTIGETYIAESWTRTQRAVDLDEATVVGEQIPSSAEPFFVTVNNNKGHQIFSGVASTPSIDENAKKTTLILKDYLTLFKSDIILNWNEFKGNTVAELIHFVFNNWKNQIDIGFKNIEIDTTNISDIQLDFELYNFEGYENVQAYDLINDAINYYSCYCDNQLNVAKKTLIYKFKKSNEKIATIKLADFGVNNVEKSFGDFNRVTIYDSKYIKQQEWALTNDNKVFKLLAPGFKEIEYIQSTGEQFIKTGHIPSGKGSKYVIDYEVPIDLYRLSLFGNRISSNYDITAFHSSVKNLSFYVGITSQVFSFDVEKNKRYILEAEAKNGDFTASLKEYDSEIINTKTRKYEGQLNNEQELYVIGSNNGERKNGYKLYSFKAYDDGVLVRDYVPCIKTDTQEVGLFDKVTNTFYTKPANVTSKFIAGKEVEKFIYPTKNKNFIAEGSINDAAYDAVMGLAQNRYQEKFDLNALQYKSIVDLTTIDFSYNIKAYMSDGSFKILPVGEIATDSNGKHIITLGHQIQYLTQEL